MLSSLARLSLSSFPSCYLHWHGYPYHHFRHYLFSVQLLQGLFSAKHGSDNSIFDTCTAMMFDSLHSGSAFSGVNVSTWHADMLQIVVIPCELWWLTDVRHRSTATWKVKHHGGAYRDTSDSHRSACMGAGETLWGNYWGIDKALTKVLIRWWSQALAQGILYL